MHNLPSDYQIEKTRSGQMTAKYKGKYLYSRYDPQKEADVFLKKEIQSIKKYIIIFGCGFGYLLKSLINYYQFDHIVTIELEEYFVANLKKNIKDNKIKIDILYRPTFSQLRQFLFSCFNEYDALYLQFIIWQPIWRIDKEYFAGLLDEVKNFLSINLANISTMAIFGPIICLNFFKNLHHQKKVKFLIKSDNPVAFPVLILASGPSLEYAIDEIKSYQNKIIIIALPSTLNLLKHKKIEPDFIINVDPGFSTVFHFKHYYSKKSILITPLTTSRHVLKSWKGKILLISQGFPCESIILNNNLKMINLPSSGTVTFSAVNLVKTLGFQSVLLIGQDFAINKIAMHTRGGGYERFYLNNNCYFQSLDYFNLEQISKQNLTSIPGDRNQLKMSTHNLKLYYNHLNNEYNQNDDFVRIHNSNTTYFPDKIIKMSLPEYILQNILKTDKNDIINKYFQFENLIKSEKQIMLKFVRFLESAKKSNFNLNKISDTYIKSIISMSFIPDLIKMNNVQTENEKNEGKLIQKLIKRFCKFIYMCLL